MYASFSKASAKVVLFFDSPKLFVVFFGENEEFSREKQKE